MLRLSIFVGLLTIFEIGLASNIKNLAEPDELLRYIISHDVHASRTARFGFSALDDLRKYFCQSFCTSADTMPYFMNLMCAIKCPELYLPHNVTTPNPTTTGGTPTANPPTTNRPNPTTQGTSTANPPTTTRPNPTTQGTPTANPPTTTRPNPTTQGTSTANPPTTTRPNPSTQGAVTTTNPMQTMSTTNPISTSTMPSMGK